jgi:AcrR family transcriptional regulator
VRRWKASPKSAFSRPSTEQRLDAMLRLATEMFNRHGIGGTSLDELAAGLGIRKPSLYNYFSSKNDLIFQCLMRTVNARSAVMDAVEHREGQAIEILALYLEEFSRVLWGEPMMFPLMAFYEYPPDFLQSPEGQRADSAIRRELDRLAALFAKGLEDGSLRKADVTVLMHAFESPFLSLTRWHGLGIHPPGSEIQATLNEFIIEGLRNRE